MTFAKINNYLLILILLVNVYVITAPLLPIVLYRAQLHSGRQQQLQQEVNKATTTAPTVGQPNHIVIPSMLLDQPIYDGPASQQYKILDKGIWRYAAGSTPDKGGNTVLVGHRFTYSNPRGVFYYLNKVKIGDEMLVQWNNTAYRYKVTSITEVLPTETSIEAPTSDARLTLFTCTPLYLPKHRLVIVAQQEAN